MTGLINIPLTKRLVLQPVNLLAMGYILIAAFALRNYLSFQSINFVLGLIALPFAWKVDGGKTNNYRYAWVVLALLVLCFLMPVKTLLYFTIGFGLLFFTELFYGKTSLLAPSVILLTSPVFQYLVDVFSFPVRIQLTKTAGALFNLFGSAAEVKGNMIIHRGNEFAVDPACMGLKMVMASLLLGIILIGFYQSVLKRKVSSVSILFYLGIVLLLNIIANLFRIVLLVQFAIPPGSSSHDIAGLGCLLVYVFIPAVWLAGFLVRRSPVFISNNYSNPGYPAYRKIVIHLFILGCILWLASSGSDTDTYTQFKIPTQQEVPGYSITSYAPGIVKLEKSGVLIYVKYIRGFYDTEHNPMICWTGSGYEFKKIENEKISNRNVFTAILSNDNDKLYSAWWYDNGKRNTTDQFEWRWDLVKGAGHYVLVNVTCSSKENLVNEIQKIVHEKTLAPFFKKFDLK